MSDAGQRLEGKAGRGKFALSIRARLMILAVIAIVPLLFDRVREIESDRAERIEAASKQALNLARQGMAAQNEAIVSVRAFLQVAASAHGLMATRGLYVFEHASPLGNAPAHELFDRIEVTPVA